MVILLGLFTSFHRSSVVWRGDWMQSLPAANIRPPVGMLPTPFWQRLKSRKYSYTGRQQYRAKQYPIASPTPVDTPTPAPQPTPLPGSVRCLLPVGKGRIGTTAVQLHWRFTCAILAGKAINSRSLIKSNRSEPTATSISMNFWYMFITTCRIWESNTG
jgi:hypothetical protein